MNFPGVNLGLIDRCMVIELSRVNTSQDSKSRHSTNVTTCQAFTKRRVSDAAQSSLAGVSLEHLDVVLEILLADTTRVLSDVRKVTLAQ